MYDMKQDPQETRNLALDIENEHLLNKLMTKLKTRMAGSGDRVSFGEDVVKRFSHNNKLK